MRILFLLSFLFSSFLAQAEFVTLTQRTLSPTFTQFFTGDRYKIFAQLDTQTRILRISAWEYGDPPEHLWTRNYPLNNQADLIAANRAMAHSELRYDLSGFVSLHENNCTSLFFPVLSREVMELDQNVARIIHRLEGDEHDLNIKHLITINTSCYGPIKLGAVLTANNEFRKFALVSGDRRSFAGMTIEEQSGHFFIKRNGVPFIRIVKENFSPTLGGEFSVHVSKNCSGENFDRYNFSVSRIRRDGRNRWLLTSFNRVDGVISLTRDRDPEIDVAEDVLEAPPEIVLGILDGIFGTIIWAFIPADTKREMIYDRVYEQARSNSSLRESFTDQELQAISRRVANNNPLRWFAPFTGQAAIKKAAYFEFSAALMQKTARESLPAGSTDADADRVMRVTTSDLKACLDAAGEQEEFDTCMAKFMRSGPYRLGKELLLAHLGQKMATQNLTTEERNAILAHSLHEYNRCAQSEYFRKYDDRIRTAYSNRASRHKTNLIRMSQEFKANDVIKACLFGSINEGAEMALDIIMDKNISDAVQDPSTRERITSQITRQFRDCIKGHGIYRETQGYKEYLYPNLMRMETTDFEQKISQCIDSTTISAGTVMIDASLRENTALRDATEGNSAQMEAVIQLTLTQGYERCLATQATPRPTDCLPLVEAVATREVMQLSLRQTIAMSLEGNTAEIERVSRLIGLSQSTDTTSPIPSDQIQFNMNQCFQDRIDTLNERLSRHETLVDNNPAVLNCIKQSILVIAPAMGQAKYQEAIAGMRVPDGVNLNSPEIRTRVETQVRTCFERNLAGIQTTTELGNSLTRITDNCTLTLYQELVPSLVYDVLRVKVNVSIEDQYTAQRILRTLDRRFRDRAMSQTTPEGVMALIDPFTLESTFFVLEEGLRHSVSSTVPGNSSAFQETLLTTVLTPERRDAITRAVNTDNQSLMDSTLQEIKRQAGVLILEHSIPLQIAEHVADEAQRQTITTQVSRTYQTCLRRIRTNDRDFDRKFATCNANAKNDATLAVFSYNLDLALEEHFPTVGQDRWTRQRNREKHRNIRAKLLTADFRKEIADTNAAGGGWALTILGYQFKWRAGVEIARETLSFW